MKLNEKKLERFRRDGVIVRTRSRFDDSFYQQGYILAWSPKWLLLKLVSDDILANGYSAELVSTLKSIKRARNGEFVRKALELRSQSWPHEDEVGRIKLTSKRGVIESALEFFPLVSVHPLRTAPDILFIGREPSFSDGEMDWREISIQGEMDDGLRWHRMKPITRIDFGGLYEQALWDVWKSKNAPG
ncbi:hypothetical protein KQI84_03845 [bacterium]|nr:hypothetical protein [bacterium]